MDIPETTIRSMLFRPKFPAPKSIAKFDHRVGQTRDLHLIRDHNRKADLIRWVFGLIAEQGSEPALVATHSEPIVSASLSFPAKVW